MRDLHSEICCFSDFGKINIFKERFIQEFLIIFCYIQVRVSLGSVCMHLFGNMHLQVVTHLWREDKDASQGAVIKVESPSDK